ncbi:MAG: hypothetical protein AAB581_03995, partial [Patescibacteria group bacterium]
MDIPPTERAVLSMLALAEAERIPALSRDELLGSIHTKESPDLALAALVNRGVIANDGGFFMLDRQENAAQARTTAKRISEEKLRAVRLPLQLICALPSVRAVTIIGSVAFENARQDSDIDVFILAAQGRAWTARLCALAIAELFGMRREKRRSPHKLCVSYI